MALKDREKYNAYMAEYMLRRYYKRRTAAIEMLGGKCIECGSNSNLEFDHTDPATKDFVVSQLWSISKKRFLLEVHKCVLRCSDCHKKKTSSERKPMTHGKNYAALQKRCRCDECLVFRTEFNRRRKMKRSRDATLNGKRPSF